MAALDNGREKFDPIAKKSAGSVEEQEKTMIKRLDIREIVGEKLMRRNHAEIIQRAKSICSGDQVRHRQQIPVGFVIPAFPLTCRD